MIAYTEKMALFQQKASGKFTSYTYQFFHQKLQNEKLPKKSYQDNQKSYIEVVVKTKYQAPSTYSIKYKKQLNTICTPPQQTR